jgi:hypothetical protein
MTMKQERAFQRLQERVENEILIREVETQGKAWARQSETARALLRDPYFYSLLLTDIAKAGLVRERRNALATYIIGTSRLREKPMNQIVKGRSSAGKNHLVKKVLGFFPPDEIVPGSSITKHAIDYAGTTRLAHKIVSIDEQTGVTHPLRQLLSEGRLIRLASVMEDGRRVMKEHVTEGPITCITTTTLNALKIDDESRNISLWIDESYKQTQAIAMAHVARKREPLSPQRLSQWRLVQRLVAEHQDVTILTPPWFVDLAEKILPYGDLRIRRYWPAFVEACKVVALIRAAAWPEINEEITVSFDDFATAVCIFDRTIGESLDRSGGDLEIATGDLVEQLSAEGRSNGVTADDLVGQPGIRSLDQAYRALRRARDAGTVYIVNERERNNEKRYARSPKANFLGTPEHLAQKLGLKISGSYVHPISGKRVAYGKA